jgi:DNA (cytosine-5)-methyltransferase 1
MEDIMAKRIAVILCGAGYKDGSEILIAQEGKNPRKLTPREAARLQGFPETFKLPSSNMQAYKQFGNSVPVPVVRAIAKKIAQSFNNINVTTQSM